MPGAARGASPTQIQIIDLTLSDDEDITPARRVVSNLSNIARVAESRRASSHRLPTFSHDLNHDTQKRERSSGPKYAEAVTQRRISPRGSPSDFTRTLQRRPRSIYGSSSTDRKLAGPPTATKAERVRVNLLENEQQTPTNVAKRRKVTHDGTLSSDHEYVPSSEGVNAPGNLAQHSTPVRKTIITGGDRSTASSSRVRISIEGAIHKPVIKQKPAKIDPIIYQILELVNHPLRKYRHQVTPKERSDIAQLAVRHLVDSPGFQREFHKKFKHGLSKEYQSKLAVAAAAFVDRYVSRMLERRQSRPMVVLKTSGSIVRKQQSHLSIGQNERGSATSESSDVEEIFERHALPDLQTSHRSSSLRINSESPTTSTTNDANDFSRSDSEKSKQPERDVQLGQSLRRSGRSVASKPSYDLMKGRRRRKRAPSEKETFRREISPVNATNISRSGNSTSKPDEFTDDDEDTLHLIVETAVNQPRSYHARQKNSTKTLPRDPIMALLREREVWGGRDSSRVRRCLPTFSATVQSYLGDSLVRQNEWTDCSGDITTLTWTSDTTFVCGAVAHSDPHNMQYNKPGNLLVGSASLGTLRAFPDHRVIRPYVAEHENLENALDSMRQSQSPWLYTSVVSTAHCDQTGFTFTASFDETVKAWSVSEDGSFMELRGTWPHYGKVNFVVTSTHHDRVATACEVNTNSVRVYKFNEDAVSDSTYDLYCGNRELRQSGQIQRLDKWAYQPATIQWGRAVEVSNLLLVGYSPRSDTGDEDDIPDEKKNSGELCVWDADTSARIPISSARTQNVFEVHWHPSQASFLAATSPCGNYESEKTKTQIRLFAFNLESKSFLTIKILDCPAYDINELTIMPNSEGVDCYVTASCTDNNTYVWDTARGEDPIHILQHGEPVDDPPHDVPREMADSGVKFAAWGRSSERLYTGGSDGTVKSWNINAPPGKAHVRNLLSISGGIYSGAFSKDFSKLLIGDDTGKVHLLVVDSDLEEGQKDEPTASSLNTPDFVLPPAMRRRRPKVIIQHPEPPLPEGSHILQDGEEPGMEIANYYLREGYLEHHPGIGVFQGPNYPEIAFYRDEAHIDGEPANPLLREFRLKQQYSIRKEASKSKFRRLPKVTGSDRQAHRKNTTLDFDFSKLELSTQRKLLRDRVELDWDDTCDYGFDNDERS